MLDVVSSSTTLPAFLKLSDMTLERAEYTNINNHTNITALRFFE
jgi:hypothetical protein